MFLEATPPLSNGKVNNGGESGISAADGKDGGVANKDDVLDEGQQRQKALEDEIQQSLTLAAKEVEDELQQRDKDAKKKPINWKASAFGAIGSLASDLAVSTITKNNSNTHNMWDRAVKAAQVSADTHEQQRQFRASEMKIEYLVGNVQSSKHIGFVVHGFMTSDDDNVASQWVEFSKTLDDMVLFRLHWPAGSKKDWKDFVGKATNSGQQVDKLISPNSNKTKAKNDNPPSWVSQLTSNPWHVAQDRTVNVGKAFARFLECHRPESLQQYKSVSLIGHSLGGAVIYQTLRHITTADPFIDNAILLGAAFVLPDDDNGKGTVTEVLFKHIRNKVVNVYSQNDQALQVVFRAANGHLDKQAVGTYPIGITYQITDPTLRKKLIDLDATSRIPVNDKTIQGHSYEFILDWIAETIKDIILSK